MRRAAILALAALLVAGCNGGTVDQHALKNDSKAIDSIACEGALLAEDVAHGDTTTIFARVHSDVLRVQASDFEDALAHRPTESGIETKVRQESMHAGKVANALDRLHRHPSDDQVARAVGTELNKVGNCP